MFLAFHHRFCGCSTDTFGGSWHFNGDITSNIALDLTIVSFLAGTENRLCITQLY